MDIKPIISGVSALVGASLAGSYMAGAPFLDVATAVSGGAGAALAAAAVSLVHPSPGPGAIDYTHTALIGAASLAVVSLAAGSLDMTSVAIAAGATVGATLGEMFVVK